jgi:hypothetical protein
MSNIFRDDFRDFIKCPNLFKVEYLLVGGYAVILHGYSRTTGDMDIWVNRTEENYQRIQNAFLKFEMPTFDMSKENFLNHKTWDVFRFGRPPVAIDIMIKMGDFDFMTCYKNAQTFSDDDLEVKVIHYNQLLEAKKSASRPKDLDDLQNLK